VATLTARKGLTQGEIMTHHTFTVDPTDANGRLYCDTCGCHLVPGSTAYATDSPGTPSGNIVECQACFMECYTPAYITYRNAGKPERTKTFLTYHAAQDSAAFLKAQGATSVRIHRTQLGEA